MKIKARNKVIFLLVCLGLRPLASEAQHSPTVRLVHFPGEVKRLIAQSGLPESAWSVAVVPLPAPVVLGPTVSGFGLNADVAMNPASVMKLITTRVALGVLGPQFRHQTRIATTGSIENGVLRGDVFFQGGGDPKLVVEDLLEIVKRMRAMGIERIEGNLVIDGSRFDEPEIDPGKFDQRPTSAYNVGPHAAMVNFKAVKVWVWPDRNRQVRVMTEPRIPDQDMNIKVQLVDGGCGNSSLAGLADPVAALKVVGTLGRKCGGMDFYVSVLDHAHFSYMAFKSAWREAGGAMNTSLRTGKTPESARTLVQWDSPRPLIELVADINKMSNNPMSRQLFLNLSANGAKAATRDASTEVVRQYLASRGLVFPEMVLDNGSGLSREERISAMSLARLLTDSILAPDAQAWVDTLPIVGLEGTVKTRMRNSVIEGRAWLKTGTLEGVRALAGYVRSAEGRWVVLVAMVNHPDAARAKAGMDSLVKWAYTYH